MHNTRLLSIVSASLCLSAVASAQSVATLTPQVRNFVTVGDSIVALTNVTIIDGTGSAPKTGQTIVIRGNRIAEVGPAASVRAPAGARVMQLGGSTVIPGMVGMHDHLFYMAAGGRAYQMSYTGPRLYLASGVTTIRTTGGRSPYAEICTKEAIDAVKAGKLLFIAGQTGVDAAGKVASPGMKEQLEQVMINLLAALKSQGADFSHVAKTTTFVTSISEFRSPEVAAVRAKYLGANPPANTLVQIQQLADPAYKVEIEAIAVLP